MELSIKRSERNYILRKALSLITKDQGKSIIAISDLLKVDKTSILPLFRENEYANVKSETFVKYLYELGCSLKFKCYTTDDHRFYSEIAFEGDINDIKQWSVRNIRKHLKRQKLTAIKASELINISTHSLRAYLTQDDRNRVSTFSGIEIFSRLGMTYILEGEHPVHDIKSLLGTTEVYGMSESDDHEYHVVKIPDDSLINMLSNERISEMMRGKVKTSLGEVIRPFL